MHRNFKKLLSILLVAVMIFGSAPLAGFVGLELPLIGNLFEIKAKASTSGTCGDNLTWTFDETTGELTVSGIGAMPNWSRYEDIPWYKYRTTIKTVTIDNGVTNIGQYAFAYYENLESITIPDTVTRINNAAFFTCHSLSNIIVPDSVIYIESSAFSCCTSLVSVKLGNSMKSIGNEVFDRCSSLTSIVIPDSVTSIGQYAFSFCESLKSVMMPDGVTQIGYAAFSGCGNLTNIYYMGSDVKWDTIKIKDFNDVLSKATIHYNHIHSSKIVEENVRPTCNDDGYKKCVCVCQYRFTEIVPKLKHNIIVDKAVEATCTKTGLTAGQHCSRCNDMTIEQEIVPALNHKDTLVHVEAKAPTCTEIGWDAYEYCTACTYTTYIKKNALKHNIVIDEAIEATCNETGLTEGQHCSRCDEVTIEQEVVPALNHKDTLVQVEAKAPTCTEIGWDAYEYCTACTYTTYEEKSALEHDIIIDEAVDATCTSTGLAQGQHCSRCDGATISQEVISVKSHEYTVKYDSSKHWEECICGAKINTHNHTFGSNSLCDCGYKRVVNATIAIKNNNDSKTINYGETLKLTAVTNNKPCDSKIYWYVDGVLMGEGEVFNINFESGAKIVTVKLVDSNGYALQNTDGDEIFDSETVNVKSGFFQKLISFFKNLFGIGRVVVQSIRF